MSTARSSAPAAEAPGDAALTTAAARPLFADLREAGRILVAVSGGPDSIALLHCLADWTGGDGFPPGERPPLAVATVDHGLRTGTEAEIALVADACAALGLPHAVLAWSGPKPLRRIQEAARDARYALLVAHARTIGADRLVTAHTLDDQAETMLFRLARGTGAGGLAGMRRTSARDGLVHVRPFLGVRKARLVAACHAHGWCYCEDPSNADPRFARTRWRAVMPSLAREGLTAERLGRLSERLQRTEAALDAVAQALFASAALPSPSGWRIDGAPLFHAPEEIVIRVLREALVRLDPRRERGIRMERLERLCVGLRAAHAARAPFRATLAGALVDLEADGAVTIGPEPPRARARPPLAAAQEAP